MKIFYKHLLLLSLLAIPTFLQAADTAVYKLRLSQSLVDFPQNNSGIPSMQQSAELATNFYEVGFWGIDALGNSIFSTRKGDFTKRQRLLRGLGNTAFQYGLGWAFARYGSELPIPLGVWAHEEYHRSVLQVNGIHSKNGNWLLNRWDGTVYGVSDASLGTLKSASLPNLLYSYVSGAQAENQISRDLILRDVFFKSTHLKAPLYLYNAWYVNNYLKFATGPFSDSVKVLAPPHESKNPKERDFAGADFTAWAWDMFNPGLPYTGRDSFPNGEGVNRRVGFSDLSPEAQAFLQKQEKLSRLNFFNLALLGIQRIRINNNLQLSFLLQYTPTHFGHEIAYYLPVKYKRFNTLVAYHRYVNHEKAFTGVELGLWEYFPGQQQRVSLDAHVQVWEQPLNQGFYEKDSRVGGSVQVQGNYRLSKHFSGFISAGYKTRGWQMGNPYLSANYMARAGMQFRL